MSALLDALDDGPLLGDGAMGTMLQDLGNDEGGAPELWNVERIDVVEGVLEGYAAAGSRLITTNTFGGTRARLQMHGLEDRVEELNQAAAELARRVADRHPVTFVLGDIGPSGELMEPMGDLTIDSAAELFGDRDLLGTTVFASAASGTRGRPFRFGQRQIQVAAQRHAASLEHAGLVE